MITNFTVKKEGFIKQIRITCMTISQSTTISYPGLY